MKDIYSKENLESLVYELLSYLYKRKDYKGEFLSNNILIYSMNKLYYVNDNYDKLVNNTPIKIEEDIDVSEYFDYYNKDTLTLSMDARLSEYLYNYDVPGCEKVAEKISKIFNKHGFYYEFGSSWYLYAEKKRNN